MVLIMERVVRKFQTFEEMNESDKDQSVSLTPAERFRQFTRLKKQYMAFQGYKDDHLKNHLRNSTIKKVEVPWEKEHGTR